MSALISSLFRPFSPKHFLLILGSSLTGLATTAYGIDYGIYDARALAMGGATVAIGDTSQAVYYNPALLALHEGDKDSTRDGQVYLPNLVAQASTALEPAIKAVNDHLDRELSDALTALNSQTSPANAKLVANSASDLRKVLDKVANRDLSVDAFVGVSASQPSDHEGGAFYMGVRTIGVGTSTISKADEALLDEYIGAMNQIADGVSPIIIAMQHPDLIGTNGKFSDPTSRLTSSAQISALLIAEWGLALAKEFTIEQQPIMFGFTPKLVRVDAYRDTADFNNSSIRSVDDGVNQFSDTKSSLTTFNADVGVATVLADHYRVGFAIKDLVAKNFATKQISGPDLTVKLRPRSRLGVGYISEDLTLGLDYDVQKSTPIANESPNQQLSLGAEYKLLSSLALRLGYRHDQAGATANLSSAGIGYQGHRFIADLGYSHSSDMKGASLQLGWTF